MDRDVQRKMDRITLAYREAAASVRIMQPTKPPTKRQQYRTEERVVTVLGQLQEARKPQVAALVRLAYVRGMRSVQPKARLEEEHQGEIDQLIHKLDSKLALVEKGQRKDFWNRLRRFRLTTTMERMQVDEDFLAAVRPTWGDYPLEQRARASVQVAVDLASTAGARAAARGDHYPTHEARDAA